MIRLYVLVEGQTEEKFVKDVLAPHLGASVSVIPIIVTTRRYKNGKKRRGGGHWKHWYNDLRRLTGEHSGNDIRFTTLFDLYGLPNDFPELEKHEADRDTLRRAISLEGAMAGAVADWRVIPYLQRHEFEALVLACLDQLATLLDAADRPGVGKIQAAVTLAGGPEEVNDGEDTAPSKRLEGEIIGYEKVTHGPLAIEATVEASGLATIRKQCPRFNSWLDRLEALRSHP